MPFLIDLTDARFKIPENADVIAFIERTNPSAHSDVGSIVFDLGRAIPGAKAYCPRPSSLAYVVLHTEQSKIVAIAYGQRGFAIRLPPSDHAAAVADDGVPGPEIGAEWIKFEPFAQRSQRKPLEVIHAWCARAIAAA